MIIPHNELDPQTLRAVIEEFVTRQGAVHGHSDSPLENQVKNVLTQLQSGKAVIVFDEKEETCSIMSKQEALLAEQDPEPSIEPFEDYDPRNSDDQNTKTRRHEERHLTTEVTETTEKTQRRNFLTADCADARR
jgi:uncharacterized protein